MTELELLSVVAVLRDVQEQKLVRGQVGTIIEKLTPNVYLVEFSDDDGRAYALASLRSEGLIRLHHQTVERLA